MKYLIDIGNTHSKCALYDGTLHPCHKVKTATIEQGLRALWESPPADLESVWVASVAGQSVDHSVQHLVAEQFGLEASFITPETPKNAPIRTHYQRQQLGVDRYVCLVAAWTMVHDKCIVIDCGTASTVDGLDANACHLGGVIFPSLATAYKGLHQVAEKLPWLDCDAPLPATPEIFATDTQAAIQAGCHTMLLASVEKSVQSMRDQLGEGTPLLVTGGLAQVVTQALGLSARIVSDLSLRGIAVLSNNEV